MERVASETDGVRFPSTTVAARQYSHMQVHGQGQAQFGDRIYQGGQHVHNYPPSAASRSSMLPDKPINMLPSQRDTKFIGREDILSKMDRSLNEAGCVALTGAGGVGKTKTAIEYCWRFRNTNPDFHIFRIHAGSIASFDVDYRKLARKLGLTCHLAGIDDNDMRADVKDWLNENEKWLMVIDNADQYDDFFATEEKKAQDVITTALPRTRPGAAMTIYTSRHGRVGEHLTDRPCLQLDVLSASDGLAMFRSSFQPSLEIPPTDCEVLELLEAMDFLPLSIAHAVAYLNFTKIPVAQYVRYIEVSDERLLNMLGQAIKSPMSVVRSWQISFELVRKLNNRTANLFCLMACLERQSISSDFILLFCNWKCQDLSSKTVETPYDLELPTTPADIKFGIAEINSLALIISGPDMHHSSMHRYVQAATLRHLSDSGKLLAFLEQLAQFTLTLRDPNSVLASKITDALLIPVAANLCFLLCGYHQHACSSSHLGCELLEDLCLASISLQLNSAG